MGRTTVMDLRQFQELFTGTDGKLMLLNMEMEWEKPQGGAEKGEAGAGSCTDCSSEWGQGVS